MMTPPELRIRRWLADGTRRFAQRPVFATDDLEQCVVHLTEQYFGGRKRPIRYPLSDDDLEGVVESITSNYDSACDLSYIGPEVEGATQFSFVDAPMVMIEARLDSPQFRLRRRMTIAHEIGHVVAHRSLFQSSSSEMMELFTDVNGIGPVYCLRESISRGDDWMEWQASYFGASLLMPKERVLDELRAHFGTGEDRLAFAPSSDAARRVVQLVSERFDVSLDASRIRLVELRIIEPNDQVLRLPLG